MKILVLNSGSSTLKFDLMDARAGGSAELIARGTVDRIGTESTLSGRISSGEQVRRDVKAKDHRAAVTLALEWLESGREDGPRYRAEAVGHRVVHGGDRFTAPTLLDSEVIGVLESLNELAPLHNPAALQGIKAAREALGEGVPMVAVFDTAFHSTLPEHAYTYALPHELASKHKIRRYGFHGTAHEYMLMRYSEIAGKPPREATIITLQLGNGCSATAIKDGRSVDTSMGFTPLEGLVMGTRSGDLDPSIVGYLASAAGLDIDEVERLLNEESGLLGISGRSRDMRDLLQAAETDPGAALAVEIFCYRVRKYIGAYLAALGGAEAVVFGGGIGENAATIRARVLQGMEWCGLRLDAAANDSLAGVQGRITTQDSTLHAYVVPVDESLLIARHTAELVRQSKST
jgi:acetate kinase